MGSKMINETNSNVTVEQFVTALITNCPLTLTSFENTQPSSDISVHMYYGYHTGWLEDMDITCGNELLLKKNAARIIHEFLRLEMHEPDTEDISIANKLRDLYDCRVCTKHVMQVYAKGIIEGYYATDTLYLFGMNEPLTKSETDIIISLIFDVNKRISVQ